MAAPPLCRFRITAASHGVDVIDTAPARRDPEPQALRRACVLGMVVTGALAMRISSPGLALPGSAIALIAALLALWLVYLSGEPRRMLKFDRPTRQIIVSRATTGLGRARPGPVMARIGIEQIGRMGIGPCPHRPAMARLWIDLGGDRVTLLTGRAGELRPVAEALDTALRC
jgi:hypothetical protein